MPAQGVPPATANEQQEIRHPRHGIDIAHRNIVGRGQGHTVNHIHQSDTVIAQCHRQQGRPNMKAAVDIIGKYCIVFDICFAYDW